MQLLLTSCGIGVLLSVAACKESGTGSSHAASSYINQQRTDLNLLSAVAKQLPLRVCFESQGGGTAANFEKDVQKFGRFIQLGVSEWLAPLGQTAQIQISRETCEQDLSNGRIKVVLGYDRYDSKFGTGATSDYVRGYFDFGTTHTPALYLNVRGIFIREQSEGRKTIRHELGHAFGLGHSGVAGSVMQSFVDSGNDRLTADDIQSIKNSWQNVQQQLTSEAGKLPQPAGASSGRPVAHQEWPPAQTPQQQTSQTYAPQQATQESQLQPLVGIASATLGSTVILLRSSWLKKSTAQSYDLPASAKCELSQGQSIRVRILNNGRTVLGHVQVALQEALPGCALGRVGSVGYLYNAHIKMN